MKSTRKFVKDYRIQIAACVIAVAAAILCAVVGYALAGETTRLALRVYFKIHPATIVAAVPLETLVLVAWFMGDDDPRVFLESAATTSVICTALCAVIAATAERKIYLMATITLPYCAIVTVAFAAAYAVAAIRAKRERAA